MLYKILKILTNIFYRVYYKIEVKGLKKIPQGKAVIFSPNHTNAFIDPIAVAIVNKAKVRFYARGDVFKGKFINWLLNELSMSPMYRVRDGYSDARRNDKTFEECKARLANNENLLIFPEGICIQEKRLQPLKKGLARIVFQTEEACDFKKDVQVYPVGLNYSNPKKFRSKLFIHFGDPISLKKQEALLGQRRSHDSDFFTKLLEEDMRKLIITIDDKANDEMVENIIEIYLRQLMTEKKFKTKKLENEFKVRKEIAQMVNFQSSIHPDAIPPLKQQINNYLKELNQHDLRDHLLSPEAINNTKPWDFILEFMVIWMGMPIYGLGLLTNYLPYYISKRFTENKIKQNEFKASVYASMAMFLWLFNYGIQLLIVALVFRNWLLLGIYSVLVPVLGYFVLNYYPIMKKILGRWRLLRLVRKDRKVVETLMHERGEIIEQLDAMKIGFSEFSK